MLFNYTIFKCLACRNSLFFCLSSRWFRYQFSRTENIISLSSVVEGKMLTSKELLSGVASKKNRVNLVRASVSHVVSGHIVLYFKSQQRRKGYHYIKQFVEQENRHVIKWVKIKSNLTVFGTTEIWQPWHILKLMYPQTDMFARQ
jgi:hypothetical protein